MCTIKVDNETYTTACGRVDVKIWVSEYEDIDPNIFVLEQSFGMLNQEVTPKFSTVATPSMLKEYPVGAPENRGGLYRESKLYISFKNKKDYSDFMDNVNRRICKLIDNYNKLLDDSQYTTVDIPVNNTIMSVSHTNLKHLDNVLKISLPEQYNYFLMRNDDLLGKLFIDVCTYTDMAVYGTDNSDDLYRTNSIELVCSYTLINTLIHKIKELLQSVLTLT